MFGKLAQLKNFIVSSVTSLQSQRPNPPNDPDLSNKLKFMLDYILRNPTEVQFKAYHSLQAPQMTLNELLSQIYHSQTADTDQISSILHFYTFLLTNCNNELVLCKIVSDSFVVQLTEVHLDRLGKSPVNNNIEIQEINSYKIALIKAYVSRLGSQTIKYMILNDRMRVFENCVHLYEQYMKVEQQEQFGVEATCISNSMLIIIRYLAQHPQYSLIVCYQQGEKGVGYLLVLIVSKIHKSMLAILKQSELDEQRFEFLKDRILFLIDIVNSITSQEYKQKIIKETSKQLTDLRELFKEIVLNHAVIDNQNQQNYVKNIELIRVLLKLLSIYFSFDTLLPVFQQTLLPILNKFINVFRQNCIEIKTKQKQCDQLEVISKKQSNYLYNLKLQAVSILCSNMQILAQIIASGKYLSRRNSSHNQEKELKNIIINIFIDIVQILLAQQGQSIQDLLCYKSVKFVLLSLMQLTVGEHSLHQYSVLKFHQFTINKLRKNLKSSEGWDYVVLNYQYILKTVSQNLINIQDINPLEYAFCQFHDLSKQKIPLELDYLINSLYTNQCARNFRFMMVEKSTIDIKDIKLQKNYHRNFISAGWSLEPGKEISSQSIVQVCQLSHLSKGLKIPISVIDDQECLLFVHPEALVKKVILNIRYKSIQGFTVEKDIVHIRLKGLQQVLVQPPIKNPKENIAKFKDYLIQKRDKSRQRELKFIHHYLEIYYRDNSKIIEEMGQAQIQGGEDQVIPEKKQQEDIHEEHQNERKQEIRSEESEECVLAQKIDNL